METQTVITAYGLKTRVWTYHSTYGYGCSECCNGDRCDKDCDAVYSRKDCPHCKGRGWIPKMARLDKKNKMEFYQKKISDTSIYTEVIQEEIAIGKTGEIHNDCQWMPKVCDKETAGHLYDRPINPVSITIMCPTGAVFQKNENGELLYNMKLHVHSIDDSSYGIWFEKLTLSLLIYIRKCIFEYLNKDYLLNGEDLLNAAINLGANPESKNYD